MDVKFIFHKDNKDKTYLEVQLSYSGKKEIQEFNPAINNKVRVNEAIDILYYLQYLYIQSKIEYNIFLEKVNEVFLSSLDFSSFNNIMPGLDMELFLKISEEAKKMIPVDDMEIEECSHSTKHIHLTSHQLQITREFHYENNLINHVIELYEAKVITKNNYAKLIEKIKKLGLPNWSPQLN